MILYIHGFNSSPASHKAGLLGARLAALGRESAFQCPALPHQPREAIAVLERALAQAGVENTTLVGSSLGGFYATWLTEQTGCRSVLVNPAITPHEGLRSYLGPQQNLYTSESYALTEEHLVQWAGYRIERPTRMERYLLIHTTGDELLDWRIAVDHYSGCRQIVIDGSDHGFPEFGEYLDCVLEFAGVA